MCLILIFGLIHEKRIEETSDNDLSASLILCAAALNTYTDYFIAKDTQTFSYARIYTFA